MLAYIKQHAERMFRVFLSEKSTKPFLFESYSST